MTSAGSGWLGRPPELEKIDPPIEVGAEPARSQGQNSVPIEDNRVVEAPYRQIIELAAEGIVVTDAEGRITFANPRMADMLGVEATELCGHSILEFTDASDRAASLQRLERRRAGLSETGDFKFVRADGSELWTSVNSAPIVDALGTCQGQVALVADNTERREQQLALTRSETRYRLLVDHLPDTVAIVYDQNWRAILAAGGGLQAGALDPATMVGRHFDELVSPSDAPTLAPLVVAAFDGIATSTEFLSTFTGNDNLLDVMPIPATDDGPTAEVLVVARNIRAMKERERAITAGERKWRAVFDHAPVAMAQVSVDGRYLRVNAALCQLLGYPAAQLETLGPSDVTHPDDVERARHGIASVVHDPATPFRDEKRYIDSRGRVVWAVVSAVAVLDGDGRFDHLLSHYLDITALKTAEAELRDSAILDPLTGLLNRRGFETELERHDEHIKRHGPLGAVLMIDLDGLKTINDNHGHEAGDQLLNAVAMALRPQLRSTDAIARLGGDEFAVILPDADLTTAPIVAAAIVEIVRHVHIDVAGRSLGVTASVGVALFDLPDRTTRQLLVDADRNMYTAKAQGGDRHFPTATPQRRHFATDQGSRGNGGHDRSEPTAPTDGQGL